MTNENQTSDAADEPLLPVPDGTELHDGIMETIEPDLTSKNIGTLAEKYKDETPAQAKARAVRYEKAFAKYHTEMNRVTMEWNQRIHQLSKSLLGAIETGNKDEEVNVLSKLDSEIQQF